jgi:hypothetical protein
VATDNFAVLRQLLLGTAFVAFVVTLPWTIGGDFWQRIGALNLWLIWPVLLWALSWKRATWMVPMGALYYVVLTIVAPVLVWQYYGTLYNLPQPPLAFAILVVLIVADVLLFLVTPLYILFSHVWPLRRRREFG